MQSCDCEDNHNILQQSYSETVWKGGKYFTLYFFHYEAWPLKNVVPRTEGQEERRTEGRCLCSIAGSVCHTSTDCVVLSSVQTGTLPLHTKSSCKCCCCTNTHRHTYTHTQTQTRTPTHIYAHTHTHTHTHTPLPLSLPHKAVSCRILE